MNTTDTTRGAVPGTTPGAGALALAPEVLTIDKEGLRASLFMVWNDSAAVECLEKIYKRSKSNFALSWAIASMVIRWEDRVESIRERGGLLHIGARF